MARRNREQHGEQIYSDGLHSIPAFRYADQGEREAATGFQTWDLHKISIQLDDNSLWLLTSIDPVEWTAVGSGGGGGGGGVAISAGTQIKTSGTVSFANSNGLSWGLNNGTLTGNYNPTVYATGNTTGQTSGTVGNSMTYIGSGLASVGVSNNQVTINAEAEPMPKMLYVSIDSPAGGNGSPASPFNNYGDAIAAAESGASIMIAPGDYTAQGPVTYADKTLRFIGTDLDNFSDSGFATIGVAITVSATANMTVEIQGMNTHLKITSGGGFITTRGVNAVIRTEGEASNVSIGGAGDVRYTTATPTSVAVLTMTNGTAAGTITPTVCALLTTTTINGIWSLTNAFAESVFSACKIYYANISATGGHILQVWDCWFPAVPGGTFVTFSGSVQTDEATYQRGLAVGVNWPADVVIVDRSPPMTQVNPFGQALQLGAQNNASLHIQPVTLPYMVFSNVNFPVALSYATNTTGSATFSMGLGLYTNNASTLSLMHSQSTTVGITYSGTANSTNLSGTRNIVMPWTTTVGIGNYYAGVVYQSTTGGNNASFSQIVGSQVNMVYSGVFGSGSNATVQQQMGQGYYTATTAALPTSIGLSQIHASVSNAYQPPIWNVGP